VYDPYGRPRPITEKQKNYWAALLEKAREARGAQATTAVPENWSGFSQQAATATTPEQKRSLNTIRRRFEAQRKAEVGQARIDRRQARIERQQTMQAEQQQVRSERRQDRTESQSSESRRPLRQRMEERRRQASDE
jgi:hypothetical protein